MTTAPLRNKMVRIFDLHEQIEESRALGLDDEVRRLELRLRTLIADVSFRMSDEIPTGETMPAFATA